MNTPFGITAQCRETIGVETRVKNLQFSNHLCSSLPTAVRETVFNRFCTRTIINITHYNLRVRFEIFITKVQRHARFREGKLNVLVLMFFAFRLVRMFVFVFRFPRSIFNDSRAIRFGLLREPKVPRRIALFRDRCEICERKEIKYAYIIILFET